MGIDIHTLNFLRYVKKKKVFGATATLGKQELHIKHDQLKSLIKKDCEYLNKDPSEMEKSDYADHLLNFLFLSSKVDSFDFSTYENANKIYNLNEPIKNELLMNYYDTVIDVGTSQYIFDIKNLYKNIINLTKVGGQIIHVLPANNFCGFGFFQFSPEFYLSLYSEKNGFINTEIFIAELTNLRSWFKVKKFDDHEIRQIISDKPAYVLVRTEKINNDQEFKNIIYRDYSRESKKQKDQNFDYDEHSFMGKVKNTIKSSNFFYAFYSKINFIYRKIFSTNYLNARNKWLEEINIEKILKNG